MFAHFTERPPGFGGGPAFGIGHGSPAFGFNSGSGDNGAVMDRLESIEQSINHLAQLLMDLKRELGEMSEMASRMLAKQRPIESID